MSNKISINEMYPGPSDNLNGPSNGWSSGPHYFMYVVLDDITRLALMKGFGLPPVFKADRQYCS